MALLISGSKGGGRVAGSKGRRRGATMKKIDVYLEVGSKRVFAGAIDWPGWERSGRDQEAAVQALIDAGPRYAKALGNAGRALTLPKHPADVHLTERLRGNATTDFGAPGIPPKADQRPLDTSSLREQIAILKASWAAFARSAKHADGAALRKGPRGGGRDLDAIVRHVAEAESSYLYRLGDSYKPGHDPAAPSELQRLRKEILDMLVRRVDGEPLPPSKRTAPLWAPRYFVRRTAWHALDHAWEIEDRADNR
jgi:hypothetical protein